MKTLDVGCGEGKLYSWIDVSADDLTGIDSNPKAIAAAQVRFPHWTFVECHGEKLPFTDQSFERIVSNVALPYMNIPAALAEMYRVLVPDGWIHLSLHPPSWTLTELGRCFPNPKASLGRLSILVIGSVFHLTGRSISLKGHIESFQTERGMRQALRRAGFQRIQFVHKDGRFFATAQKCPRLVNSSPENTRRRASSQDDRYAA